MWLDRHGKAYSAPLQLLIENTPTIHALFIFGLFNDTVIKLTVYTTE
jgi:hypothetical protein